MDIEPKMRLPSITRNKRFMNRSFDKPPETIILKIPETDDSPEVEDNVHVSP